MGKFIETMYPKIEDRVNRWETLGMLDTVKSDDSKKLIAMTLDAATIYITNFKPINLDEDTKNIINNSINNNLKTDNKRKIDMNFIQNHNNNFNKLFSYEIS